MSDPAGVLLVDKPATWTSHDVVAFVRRFGFRKVGHAGTLDPAATGVLVLLIGREATKAAGALTGQDKLYAGTIRLGIDTDSYDADGAVVQERPWEHLTAEAVEAVCLQFQGDIMQVPPMVSAVKVGGKRLYELARQGVTIERAERPVTIHSLTVERVALPEVQLRVHCSKGTYIRTLAFDIGARLGCGAHLNALSRLASGSFELKDAVTMEQLRGWDRDAVIARLLPVPETGAGR